MSNDEVNPGTGKVTINGGMTVGSTPSKDQPQPPVIGVIAGDTDIVINGGMTVGVIGTVTQPDRKDG